MPTTFHSKVVFLGSSASGKSSLCVRYMEKSFDPYRDSTIGAAFYSRLVECPPDIMKLDLWDTAGQERYRALAPMYVRGADAVVIVYDITDDLSYAAAKEWHDRVKDAETDVILVLVGNKTDLEAERTVPYETALAYAQASNMLFFETSAKTGFGVLETFDTILDKVPRRTRRTTPFPQTVRIPKYKSPAFGWCGL